MNNELYHYGVKNMHWGVRRWQNEDGSYKPGGAEHYYTPKSSRDSKKIKKAVDKYMTEHNQDRMARRIEKVAYKNLKNKDVSKVMDLNKKQNDAMDRLVDTENEFIDKNGWVDENHPKYKKAWQEYSDAFDAYENECKNIAEQLLGKYGQETVKGIKLKYSSYAKDGVKRAIHKIGKRKV